MKKYIKPILNVENLEIKEVIAALTLSNVNGAGAVDINEKDVMSWDSFWN